MKRNAILAMIMAASVMIGCQKEDANNGAPESGEATNVEIRLANPSTYAPNGSEDGEEYENAIKTLEIYVFDANGDPDKKLGQSAIGNDGNGYYKTTSLTGGKVTNLIVSSGAGKTFVAVANMNLGPLTGTQKYADLKDKLAKAEFLATAGTSNHNARDQRLTTGFEMLGEKDNVTIVAAEHGQRVNVAVERLVSKVAAPTFLNGSNPAGITLTDSDIEEVWGENSGITNSDLSFQFDGYALVNGINKSHLYFIGNSDGDDTNTPWEISHATWAAGKSYLNSSFDTDGFYTNNYSGYGSADWFLAAAGTDAIYFNENKPGTIVVDGQLGYDPQNVYAMMVKGTIKVATNPSKDAVRYWRLNMVKSDDFHILRNCVYRLNVKEITSPGYGNPEEAEGGGVIPGRDEAAADVEVSVKKWRVNAYEYEGI